MPLVNAQFLAAQLPHNRLVTLDAGPFAWEEAPDEYAAMIANCDRRPAHGPGRTGARTSDPTGATDALGSDAGGTKTHGGTMSITQVTIPSPPEGQDLATVPMKFEVTPLPITDFDRAKAFYSRLGWRLDIDLQFTEQVRAVQFTPPGSPASIQFGPPGAAPLQRLLLAVEDIEAARAELVDRGIDVGEIFHAAPGQPPEPGRDPEGRSYVSQAAFSDPDGNQWVLQEITERIPGRVEITDSAPLAELLLETAKRHGEFEAVAPPHDWWDWYGAYMEARESGSTPDEAAAAAGRYMADVKHVVVSPA